MSNYQRLISYIYTYEGGIKGKNIGFAKLETRNVQCKITVSVKKIFVGGNPMGVYLLSNQGELRIGTLFARNGAGEFRVTVNSSNIEDSGRGIEEFYGLSVHDVESAWRAYTTIWEDAVAHAAEVELAEVTSENLLKKQNEQEELKDFNLDQELPISKEIEAELEAELKEEPEREGVISAAAEEQEEVISAAVEEHEGLISPAISEQGGRAEWHKEGRSMRESILESQTAAAAFDAGSLVMEKSPEPFFSAKEAQPEVFSSETGGSEITSPEITVPEISNPGTIQPEIRVPGINIPEITQPERPQPEGPQPELPRPETQQPGMPQPKASERMERPAWPMPQPEMEPHVPGIEIAQPEKNQQELWEYLRKHHAKILAFDYEDGCEILVIKPQDIGLLPRDNWVFGNNSFLLHGYYGYRYLILARLENPWGMPRYLLGVPGNYLSNEKYMAAMFGFPDFVLSKKQPSKESKFGYWYTEIKIGD